jgi:hypothetical protein
MPPHIALPHQGSKASARAVPRGRGRFILVGHVAHVILELHKKENFEVWNWLQSR